MYKIQEECLFNLENWREKKEKEKKKTFPSLSTEHKVEYAYFHFPTSKPGAVNI